MTSYKNTVKSLRMRYVIGLSAIAILVTASFLMMQHVISQQHFHSRLVNLAGHQAGLSNRIAYFVSLMASTSDADEFNIAKSQVGRTINKMEQAHNTLRKGDPSNGIPHVTNDNLETIYSDPMVGLDLAMERFLTQAVEIYKSEMNDFSVDSQSYIYLTTYGPHVLEPMLDAAVDEYEIIGKEAILKIKNLERAIWIATIIALMLELAFIFIPLESRVKKTLLSLEETIKELTQIRKRLLSAQKLALVGDWELNANTNLLTWSDQLYDIFSVDKTGESVPWDFFMNRVHPEDRGTLTKMLEEITDTGKSFKCEYRIITPAGNERLVYQYATQKFDGDQDRIIISGTIQDITERKELSTRLEKLSEHVPGFIFQCHKNTRGIYQFSYASKGVEETCGISPERLTRNSNTLFRLVHQDDMERVRYTMEESSQRLSTWHAQYRINHPLKGEIWQEGHASPGRMVDGSVLWYGYIWDITERKKSEDRIHKLALYDPLTGLANRRLMMDRLVHALNSSQRYEEWGGLIMLDLDNFKTINDTHGHEMGDALLIEVAERINSCSRESDTISRLGGDEFVIILEALGKDKEKAQKNAMMAGEKVRAILNNPYYLDGGKLVHYGSSSIGVTIFQGKNVDESNLLKRADIAMYEAKEKGRNTVCLYREERLKEISDKNLLTQELQNALVRNELTLHFQPQVNRDYQISGAETLLRWFPENSAPISPGVFIPLAESCGLILTIGDWVIKEACSYLGLFLEKDMPENFALAINISAHHFSDPLFIKKTKEAIQKAGINANQLKFEITESCLVDDFQHVNRILTELKELGLQVELDDFGTGYSSMNALYNLPINALKVDRSLVGNLSSESPSKAIVRASIAMAKAMSLKVIAEGVETREQSEFLKSEGVDYQQGFLFSKAISFEDFVDQYSGTKATLDFEKIKT